MLPIKNFKKISNYIWEVPKSFRSDMKVPGRIYISKKMLEDILDERSVEQLVNVATLPGIEKYSLAMPDIHQGYGFPIGGVAGMRTEDGVISPGGVGYDINCGVRLLTSSYNYEELENKITDLANQMQRDVPSGVGRGGQHVLDQIELNEVLNTGVKWAIKKGLASEEDAQAIEENGSYKTADASLISDHAKKRGKDQLGTLGAGNHFVELQVIIQIFDEEIAKAFGIFKGQVTVMIHTGSRGLGHQVCTDYVKLMDKVMESYNIKLPDRELACVPFKSKEGQQYFGAMAAAANFAWTNRQLITNEIRGSWNQVLKSKKNELSLVYDVAHNMAKVEKHNGKELVVHRKGATRAFGSGSPEIPEKYKQTGQPVLIPGSMGTFSYVLAGTKQAMEETFGSTCHGAGRTMSRMKAKKTLDYNKIKKELDDKGIVIRAGSAKELLEESPYAYKDIDNVVDVVSKSGIAKIVAKMRPLAVIKG